jgi:hypothetical protein
LAAIRRFWSWEATWLWYLVAICGPHGRIAIR